MSSKTSAANASSIHPPVGTLIDGGSLELVEVLGVGGYGVVYRAVDTRFPTSQKSYAVKCLVTTGLQTPRQRQIHIREITLHQLASAHSGVVTLHRIVEQGSYTYIVMDYAPDHDLFTQILHNCRYLGNDALIKDIFLQLLDAVEYCHTLGIYHRDLKPENVLCFDGGLRVSITDFGLATTDKVSDEFRTGSVYHMSPECQGGDFAPTGNYSPMFNDIWSLGIILLNLATGRNPWKSATANDPTFQAYLRDPTGFLPTVLPISPEINDILIKMLDFDWRERSTIREVRCAIEEVTNFYSDNVVFEGSMARCPWESGMDIDSASSGSNPNDTCPLSPPSEPSIYENFHPQMNTNWSKDSDSEIAFANQSLAEELSSGARWINYSSCGATWAYESPVSSHSDQDHYQMDLFDRPGTASSGETAETSLPATPNSLDLAFGSKIEKPDPRSALMINTNLARPRVYDVNTSMTSYSTGTSVMHTAIEFDPYSSNFFLSSPISPINGKGVIIMPNSAVTAVGEDKEMSDPSAWTPSSATEMSSPSSFSEYSQSIYTSEFQFTRSTAPSPFTEPDVFWTSPSSQVQSLYQQCQLSSSFSTSMTHIISRLSNTIPSTTQCTEHTQTNNQTSSVNSSPTILPKALSRFAKLFPRTSSPAPPPTSKLPSSPISPQQTQPNRHAAPESPDSPLPRGQTPSPIHEPPSWDSFQPQGGQAKGLGTLSEDAQPHQQQHQHQLRSTRHWFIPGRFRNVGAVN